MLMAIVASLIKPLQHIRAAAHPASRRLYGLHDAAGVVDLEVVAAQVPDYCADVRIIRQDLNAFLAPA